MTQEVCPHCGASLKKYWHRLTPGLVKTLVKIYSAVSFKNVNMVVKGDLDLDHSEYGNFQKLRFHGLIAKYKIGGVWKRGEWLITRRGADFLKGNAEIPYRVQTFRNHVVGHDAKKLGLRQIMQSDKYFEGYEDFKNQLEFMVFPEEERDDTPEIRTYRKRGKRLVCDCGGRVIGKFIQEGEPVGNTIRGVTHLVCMKCQFDFGEAKV